MKKYVYKNKKAMERMHSFYDRAMDQLGITYREEYYDTSYGRTHVIIAGDETKPRIFTVHGGNGITPVNLDLFRRLLDNYCIIAPDVIGMPGKSAPYRTLDTNKDDFGIWLTELLDAMDIQSIPFVVSSYSSAMALSLAAVSPERIEKLALVVPSGIAHGPLSPIIRSMAVPMMKYYFAPSKNTLNGILSIMSDRKDEQMTEFFDLMMSSYKMEMRPPREYRREELRDLCAPVIIFASDDDIFFPADRVFPRARRLFRKRPVCCRIRCRHLPSEKTMKYVCAKITEFFSDL